KMKKLWNRISFLGLEHLDKNEAVYRYRENVLINRITAVFLLIIALFIPVEVIFHGWTLVPIMLTEGLIFSLPLLWNYKKWHEFAKYYLLFIVLLITGTMPFIVPQGVGNELFMIPASTIGVLLFRQKWKALSYMLLTL